MAENIRTVEEETRKISILFKEIEKRIAANRTKHNDADKTIKDFRRIFDHDSAKMNQAIFNQEAREEVYQETLQTVSVLVEILLRTKK